MWIKKLVSNTSLLKNFFCTRSIEGHKKYSQTISKARPIIPLYQLQPWGPGNDIFIAPNATLAGQVFIGKGISIWHGTVIRGDINSIFLHNNISIGDNCVLHTAGSLPSGLPAYLQLKGENVVQSGCTLYSCTLQRKAFIGYNSVILEGAVIGQGAIVAPNSVVPPGRLVPAYQVWGGNPIKFVRHAKEQTGFVTSNMAQTLIDIGQVYKYQFLPYNNAYLFKQNTPQESNIKNYDYPNMTQAEYKSKAGGYDPSNPTIH